MRHHTSADALWLAAAWPVIVVSALVVAALTLAFSAPRNQALIRESEAPRGRAMPKMLTSAAIAATGAALVGGAEVTLRTFPQLMPKAALFQMHDQAIADQVPSTIPDRTLGYIGAPDVTESFEAWTGSFTFTTDATGFRNPNPWPERADIVVVGDSQAFGFGVADDAVWARRLDEALPGAAVVNLGLIGAAPQQFAPVYEAFGAPFGPRVVVAALFAPNAAKIGRLFADWHAAGRPGGFDAWRFGDSEPNGFVERIKDRARRSYLLLGFYHGLRTVAGASGLVTMGDAVLVPARYGDEAARAKPGIAEFENVIAALDNLRHMVERDGAELIVVPVPTKEEVLLPLAGVSPNAVTAPFITALNARGIRSVNLIPDLRERSREKEIFLPIDLHPNAAGHEAIASVLIRHLGPLIGEKGPSA